MNKSIKTLRYFSAYEKGSKPLMFTYSGKDDANFVMLRKFVKLNMNNKSDLEKAHILLNYTYNNLIPGNDHYDTLKENCNSIFILKKTKTDKIRSNCYMYSVVLTELLLCYGIKARLIICRPFDFYKNSNCHCMVHAYIKSIERWIALDPANCASFRDINGNFISISEIRKKIINDKYYSIFCSTQKNSIMLKNYLPYYLFSFFSFENNGFNLYTSKELNRVNVLLPILFKTEVDLDSNINIVYNDNSFWSC